MVSPRLTAQPGVITQNTWSGLLDTAQNVGFADAGWRAGLSWHDVCPGAAGFYDFCVTDDAEAEPKAVTANVRNFAANAFAVYTQVDCSPVGSWSMLGESTRRAFQLAEQYAVEQAFWTGVLPGQAATSVYPHLASTTLVADPATDSILNLATDVVTPAAQTAPTGVGLLIQALQDCAPVRGMLHAPISLAPIFDRYGLITTRDSVSVLKSTGIPVVFGSGYPGSGPDGVKTDGESWVYATGPVWWTRDSEPRMFDRDEVLDRTDNTLRMMAERMYLLGYDCCLLGIPILEETI